MKSETGIQLMHQAKQAHANGEYEKARQLESEARLYLTPSAQGEIGAGNECLPQATTGIEGYRALQIKETLENPSQVAIDASLARMELLQQAGVLELGLDLAESIGAQNSIEKMLAHQAATCHQMALKQIVKSEEYQATGAESEKRERLNLDAQTRCINTACKLMNTFQRSVMTIQKLRTGGRQVVTVQHQHVQVNNVGGTSQTLIHGKGGGHEGG